MRVSRSFPSPDRTRKGWSTSWPQHSPLRPVPGKEAKAKFGKASLGIRTGRVVQQSKGVLGGRCPPTDSSAFGNGRENQTMDPPSETPLSGSSRSGRGAAHETFWLSCVGAKFGDGGRSAICPSRLRPVNTVKKLTSVVVVVAVHTWWWWWLLALILSGSPERGPRRHAPNRYADNSVPEAQCPWWRPPWREQRCEMLCFRCRHNNNTHSDMLELVSLLTEDTVGNQHLRHTRITGTPPTSPS